MATKRQFTTLTTDQLALIHKVRSLLNAFDASRQQAASTARDSKAAAPAPRVRAQDGPKTRQDASGRVSGRAPVPAPAPYRVLYRAADGRVKAPAVPPRDRQVYEVIRKSHGVTRGKLLKALRASTHTGIVDGAVRRLRERKLIEVADAATM